MINYDLKRIKAIAFDVDGVLSRQTIALGADGQPMRTVNIRDGYAIQLAVKMGLRLAIITGGKTEAVRLRYANLGVEDVFMSVSVKIDVYNSWLKARGLQPEEVIFVGDDIPDYEVMRASGCPCCPADAATEVRQVATYISPLAGGEGVGRDIVEQVLRAQGRWMAGREAFGW